MRNWFQNKYDLLIVNSVVLIYVMIVIPMLDLPPTSSLLLYADDALQYFNAWNEYINPSFCESSNIRPFFYPLFVRMGYLLFGVTGIWLLQLGMWIASANFIFFALKRMTNRVILASVGVLLFLLNFSLLSLCYHALTEVITVFFLSWIMFIISKKHFLKDPYRLFRVLFLLVLLACTKPLFQIPLIIYLLFFVLYHLKQFRKLKNCIFLVLMLTPILFQYSMMKIKYNKWMLSEISTITVRKYIVAQNFEQIHGMSRKASINKSLSLTKKELAYTIWNHKSDFWNLFYDNISTNVKGAPIYLSLGPQKKKAFFYQLQEDINKQLPFWYKLVFVLVLLSLIVSIWKKKLMENLPYFGVSLLIAYIIIASGISFYQGDRLTIIAYPLGVVMLFYWGVFICRALINQPKRQLF